MSQQVWRVALALSRGNNTHTGAVISGIDDYDQGQGRGHRWRHPR